VADFAVDKEFQALIPPLRPEELAELERSVLAEGCRDALVVWKEKAILLDGHHRYAICKAHGIKFQTRAISFADRDAAAEWMDRNQLGRRNLAPLAASEIRGRIERRAERKQGVGRPEKSGQNVPITERSAALGVSAKTLRRDVQLSKDLDALGLHASDLLADEVKPPTRRKIHDAAEALRKEVLVRDA